jgi:pimeloyl-ACP methyl ester carboxylesterase
MGRGAAVVFVHGTLAGMDTFRRQLLWFGGRARAITYSRRFHPPSGPDAGRGPYVLDEHAADLIGFLDALELEKPHIAASSYGAYVAIRASLMKPGLASSLVAAEPPMLRLLESTAEGRGAFAAFDTAGLEPARKAFARGDVAEGAARFFDGIRGEPGAFGRLTNLQQADLLRFGPELRLELSTEIDLFMPHIPPDRLGGMTTPTLLLSGERSPELFHIITSALHAAIPGSTLVSIPGADHSIHTSAPAAYNEAVWKFISTDA